MTSPLKHSGSLSQDAIEHYVLRRVLHTLGAVEQELLTVGKEFERLRYPLILAALNTVGSYIGHRLYPGPKLRVETVNFLTCMDEALGKLKARCRELSFAELARPNGQSSRKPGGPPSHRQ